MHVHHPVTAQDVNSLEEQKAFVEEGLRKAQGNSKRSTLDAKMERWQQERSRAKEQLEQSQVAEGDTKGAHAEATVRTPLQQGRKQHR